jgi:predicted transposase/invertase (TIGR01784 family)
VEPATPHDALFKAVFSQPEHAAGELRHLLPPTFAERIDWPTLALVSGAYVDEDLRHSHSDLLFSARCEGASVLLYLLFEHQSTHDPLMAYRLLRYMVRIWEAVLAEDPARARGGRPARA